jgi:hypothetical protein
MGSPGCNSMVSASGWRTEALPSATKWNTTALRGCTANPHGPATRVRASTRPSAQTAFNQPLDSLATA